MHRGARQQRRVDLERRVLGGGPDEGEQARFHMRQEGVLLRLVEAVHLVHEQHRGARPDLRSACACVDRLADVLDAGQHRRQHDEVRVHVPRPAGAPAWSCPRPAGPTGSSTATARFKGHAQRPARGQQVRWPMTWSSVARPQRSASGASAPAAGSGVSNRASWAGMVRIVGSGPRRTNCTGPRHRCRELGACRRIFRCEAARTAGTHCALGARLALAGCAARTDGSSHVHSLGICRYSPVSPASRHDGSPQRHAGVPVLQARRRGVRHRHPQGAGDPRLRAAHAHCQRTRTSSRAWSTCVA
jgi:hypothetical protein